MSVAEVAVGFFIYAD